MNNKSSYSGGIQCSNYVDLNYFGDTNIEKNEEEKNFFLLKETKNFRGVLQGTPINRVFTLDTVFFPYFMLFQLSFQVFNFI